MPFEIGKKYRRRDGGVARLIAKVESQDFPYVWAYETILGERVFTTTWAGTLQVNTPNSEIDIVSGEPIREPVEVKVEIKFGCVWERPDGSRYIGSKIWRTKEEAESQSDCIGHAKLGIYELPEKILVTPR